jgi:bifunctional UDP-N-acetylglucosamine pyrophosphorylase/glucosamine-1-phosphate N-acetyltransferase
VTVLSSAGYPVDSMVLPEPVEASGVNDRAQLAFAEAELRARTNRRWLLAGVTMLDPARTYVDVTVELSADVTLFPGTMLHGRTVVGPGTEIGPDCRLVDCVVGPGAVLDHTIAHDAEIGEGARVGPYAVLPPGSVVPAWSVTGPFYTGMS